MADDDRERRLRELFDRALTEPPSQREQIIAEAGDELLAERLRALLLQDALGTAGVLQRSPADSLQALRRIGRYELLRELGRGGMGTVLLARQMEPVERLVALKMLHDSSDSKEVEQRFAIERQALAVMNHPGIARIFDGGTSDDGLPYFVMEYVRGQAITTYCDRRQLDCAARIDLFVKVCEAVQHAHQKAVLHRDLKPGNVLVTEQTGRPRPKVIDFGVARALSGLGQQLTGGGAMIGTLPYMSPEQADPAGQDLDTRADIYSLGVLLYQLLTGELPLVFDAQKHGLAGFQRTLLETTPPRASERVSSLPIEQQQLCARNRSTTPTSLCRQLRDDLDWILMRALEKDRNRRYASATELAADLLRHRQNEPVMAGPPTLRYRAAKFVRRNRYAVLGAVLVTLGLTIGLVGAMRGMFVARTARDAEAEARLLQARQLQRERAVGDYFEFLLFYGDPGTGSKPPSLRQVLDDLAPTIARRFADQPVEAAAVFAGVGRAYLAAGEPTKAEAALRAAWDLMAKASDEDPGEACMVLYDLGRAKRGASGAATDRNDLIEMLTLGARALAAQPELALGLQQLTALLQQRPAPSAALMDRCTELFTLAGTAARDSRTIRITGRLLAAVGVLMQEERLPGSDTVLHQLEALTRRALGTDIDFLQVLDRLGENQLRHGRFDDARRLSSEVLDGLQRLGLREHWLQLHAERMRGLSLALGGEPAAGETVLVALQRRLWALPATANEEARAAATVLAELCGSLTSGGQLDEFLAASFRRWQQVVARDPACAPWWPVDTDGLPAPATAAARNAVEGAIGNADSPQLQSLLGSLLLREDRTEAAAAALESAFRAQVPPTPELSADLAIARLRLGDAANAAAILAELQAGSERAGPDQGRRQRALQRVVAASGR